MKYKTQIQKKHYLVSKRWSHNNQKTVSGVWKAKNTKGVDTASCPRAHRTAVPGQTGTLKGEPSKNILCLSLCCCMATWHWISDLACSTACLLRLVFPRRHPFSATRRFMVKSGSGYLLISLSWSMTLLASSVVLSTDVHYKRKRGQYWLGFGQQQQQKKGVEL